MDRITQLHASIFAGLSISFVVSYPTIAAAAIAWSTPTTLVGDADVSTAGSLAYAYHWSSVAANRTVNGVTFTHSGSVNAGADVTLAFPNSTNFATFGGTKAPFTGLSSAYQALTSGVIYNGPPYSGTVSVSLKNLTIGHDYQIQVWLNDSRPTGDNRNATLTSTGGNSVSLKYNATNTGSDGGVGQYSLGSFTADATVQTFTCSSTLAVQLNALQLRDQGISSVAGSGTWTQSLGGSWTHATNWLGSGIAAGIDQTADFSTLTLSNDAAVTVDTHATIGNLTFDDQSAIKHAWTLDGGGRINLAVSSGFPVITARVPVTLGIPLTGIAGLTKAGDATLTLASTNTYQGATKVSAGTLRLETTGQRMLPSGLKIMPLGDSITYGASGNNAGYRSELSSLLAPIAPAFQFMGVSRVNPASLPTSPIDQTYHNGFPSYATLHLSNNLDGIDPAPFDTYGGAGRSPQGGYWLVGGNGTGREPLYPDVVLLMAGANDIFWNTSQINTANYQANLTTLIGKITTARPSARIIVAKITPWPAQGANVATVNNGVTTVVSNFKAKAKNVSSVDLNTGFPADGLSNDGLHPGDIGYTWMAGKWYDAILAAVGTVPSLISTSLPAASDVSVAAGATLDLNNSQATISGLEVAGNLLMGVGKLNTTGPSTFTQGSTLSAKLTPGTPASTRLAVTGNLALGNATLNLTSLGATPPTVGTKFTLATYTGSLSGIFAELPEGATVSAGSTPFIIRYADGGKIITLTVSMDGYGD